jgi:hypothetical protein
VRLFDLSDRGDRLFVGFLASMAVVTAILGWQAVESQEVKSALQGGLEHPVRLDGRLEEPTAVRAGVAVPYVNTGDRALTLEGAGLIEPTDNLHLIEVLAREPGASEPEAIEGFDVEPGSEVELIALVQVTGPAGEPAGFEGLRVHYHAGGRAGQAP